MNDSMSQPKSNIFCITGILASMLLILAFLGEGNARTFPNPPDLPTQNRETLSEWNTIYFPSVNPPSKDESGVKSFKIPQKDTLKLGKEERAEREGIDKNDQPQKKRMGLALLFLGILAEGG